MTTELQRRRPGHEDVCSLCGLDKVLDYPTDSDRRKYFPKEDNESRHGATLEVRTLLWCIQNFTQPGDLIIDPMSGTGTIHIAATMGRETLAIELSPEFVETQYTNLRYLDEHFGINAEPTVLEGDCRRHLPQAALELREIDGHNAVIFSPPYGSLWKNKGRDDFYKEKGLNVGYDDQISNIGNLTVYPQYLEAMKQVYMLCAESLSSGEYMILVTKDYVKNKARVLVSRDNVRVAMESGFNLHDWHYRYTNPKIFQIMSRKRREERGGTDKDDLSLIVDYEDILIMRRV